MSALSAVPSTRVPCRRKFGEVSSTECTGQGNDFELISVVKMKPRHPVEGYLVMNFHRSISLRSYGGLKSQEVKKFYFFAFLEKRPLAGKLSNCCSESSHRLTDRRRVVFKFREI